MAPPNADTGRSAHSSNGRPAIRSRINRIVPAVPLTYSRPSAPPLAKNAPADVSNNESSTSPENGEPSTPVTQEPAQLVNHTDENGNNEVQAPVSDEVFELEEQSGTISSQDNKSAKTEEPKYVPQPQSPPQHHTRNTSTILNRIPNELPPPFYPSEHRSTPTPTSATSSVPYQTFPSNNVTMHHPRPSPSRIVFGGYADSSNTSPAPPPNGMMPFHGPPPHGFMPPNYGPPHFFPAHTHHLSDPHIASTYPPMGPPPNGFGYRREHHPGRQQQQQPQPPWLPPDGMPFGARPPQDFLYPRPPYGPPNGHPQDSRSPSQSSSRNQELDMKRPDLRAPPQDRPQTNGTDPNSIQPSSEMRSLYQLRDWLSFQFSNQALADCVLKISIAADTPLVSIPVHRMIIARSLVLRHKVAQSAPPSPGGPLVLTFKVSSRFFNSQSYFDALRFLYGGPLLTTVTNEPLPPFHADSADETVAAMASERVERALAYLVAGGSLGIPEVVADGLTLVGQLLRWDTLEKILEFVSNATMPMPAIAHGGGDEHDTHNFPPDTSFAGTKAVLERQILSFLAEHIPKDFILNTTAPQLAGSPLFPPLGDNRPSKHHPRLSQIRFGELPPDASPSATFCTNLISSVLFSLQFASLKSLLESHGLGQKLGQNRLLDLGRNIIQEREARRKKLTRSHQNLASDITRHPLWSNTFWEESISINSQAPSGVEVLRESASGETPVVNGHSTS